MKYVLALVFLLLSTAAFGESYVIHAGAMFDSVSGTMLEERSIHVADGKIVSVAAGYEQAAGGAQVIDLRDSTVHTGINGYARAPGYGVDPRYLYGKVHPQPG